MNQFQQAYEVASTIFTLQEASSLNGCKIHFLTHYIFLHLLRNNSHQDESRKEEIQKYVTNNYAGRNYIIFNQKIESQWKIQIPIAQSVLESQAKQTFNKPNSTLHKYMAYWPIKMEI